MKTIEELQHELERATTAFNSEMASVLAKLSAPGVVIRVELEEIDASTFTQTGYVYRLKFRAEL